MRTSSLALLTAASLLAYGSRGEGQTVTTDPVGFITLPVVQAPAAGASGLSFRALGLFQPVVYQGVASAVVANGSSSQTADTLSATNTGWTANQFNGANGKFYVEILSGNVGVGSMYDIGSTVVPGSGTTQTLVLDQHLADGLAGTPSFRIRKHWTIADVFGVTNEKGLTSGGATTADVIQIFSGGAYQKYYYSNVAGNIGWRKDPDPTNADRSLTVLYPDDGLMIVRRGTTAANVVLTGAVKTGATSFPVLQGVNVIGNPYAAPMSLASCNIYTGDPATGLAAGFASTADQIQIHNGTGYDTYYYSSGGTPGVGWRKVSGGNTDRASTPIPVGTSIVVKRVHAGGFNWLIPQHPTSF